MSCSAHQMPFEQCTRAKEGSCEFSCRCPRHLTSAVDSSIMLSVCRAGVTAGKCIIDCATLAVADVERLSAQVVELGGRFLEAPVSGSKGPAAAGQLIFLTGGDQELYTSVAADLDAMGKAKYFLGAVGSGTRMKVAAPPARIEHSPCALW